MLTHLDGDSHDHAPNHLRLVSHTGGKDVHLYRQSGTRETPRGSCTTGQHTLSMVYYSLIPKLGSGSETMVHLRWILFQVLHIILQ